MRRLIVDPVRLDGSGSLRLLAAESRYLCRVLRLGSGDRLEVRDGAGGRHAAVLEDERTLRIGPREELEPVPGPDVHLGFAVPRGKREEVVLEKATELGAAALHPIVTERVVPRDIEHRYERWCEKVRSAARQCGAPRTPLVSPPCTLRSFLRDRPEAGLLLLADPASDAALRERLDGPPAGRILVLTGPEGGFDGSEIASALSAGFLPFHLGSLILRAETAPIAVLAIIRHRMGDLG